MTSVPLARREAAWLLAALSALCAYVLVEGLASGAAALRRRPLDVVELIEVGNDRPGGFDPVRGYRLNRASRRYAYFVHGRLQWQTWRRGNREGFHDLDEFFHVPPLPRRPRYAVFGDSFTAASYLNTSWTDRAEELCQAQGQSCELMNFAIDGAGLANWWSVATRHIEPTRYELDGVIFAVWGDDLQRRFTVAAPGPDGQLWLGRWPTWDQDTYPSRAAQVGRWLRPTAARQVSSPEFDRALAGEAVREPFRWRAAGQLRALAWQARAAWNAPRLNDTTPAQEAAFRQRQIDQLADQLRRRAWPALVVFLPVKPGDLAPDEVDQAAAQARAFAQRLGAQFIDQRQMFADDAINAVWLREDNHWNQAGSDRFAQAMADLLLGGEWPPRAAPAVFPPAERAAPATMSPGDAPGA